MQNEAPLYEDGRLMIGAVEGLSSLQLIIWLAASIFFKHFQRCFRSLSWDDDDDAMFDMFVSRGLKVEAASQSHPY
jgi:hypothetical protein